MDRDEKIIQDDCVILNNVANADATNYILAHVFQNICIQI